MGIAKRYASAIFDLAIEGKSLPKLESDVSALAGALADSADLRDLISSPVYTRDEQGAAITAVAQKMGLTSVMANSLALMASKRRLFVVPQLMAALRAMIAECREDCKPEFVAGGFSAHCTNNGDQRNAWVIKSDPKGDTVRARLQKDGTWKSAHGRHSLNNAPVKYYDYNF